LEQSIALYNSRQHYRFLSGIGTMEAGVVARNMAAWVLWNLGYPDQALEKIREALTLARAIAHPYSLAYASMFGSAVHTWRGEAQAALELADAVIALAREQGFPSWLATGIFFRGYALAVQGEEEKGIAQMLEGDAVNLAVGPRSSTTRFLSGLLEAYLKRGQTDEAAKVLAEALELDENTGQRYQEARLYRLKGELLLMRDGADDQAEQSFRTAIRIAQSQSAKSLELRATTSLARLLAKQGWRDEARTMLAEIYGWFTEGLDTADLNEAKALLDELI
jgi:predicted ATPase